MPTANCFLQEAEDKVRDRYNSRLIKLIVEAIPVWSRDATDLVLEPGPTACLQIETTDKGAAVF